MSFDRYAEWLSRGRTHQAAGRVIDALLCYRRALRELRRASTRSSTSVRSPGTWATRRTQSPRGGPLARFRRRTSLPGMRSPMRSPRRATRRRASTRSTMYWRSRPTSHAPWRCGCCWARREGSVSDASLAHALTTASWPLPLLARIADDLDVAERLRALPAARAALVDAALAAIVVRGSEDALRGIANAAARAGDGAAATACADRYADACRALYRVTVPSLWALRTAGKDLRLGLLCAPGAQSDATVFREALIAGGLRDVSVVVLVAPGWAPEDASRPARRPARRRRAYWHCRKQPKRQPARQRRSISTFSSTSPACERRRGRCLRCIRRARYG